MITTYPQARGGLGPALNMATPARGISLVPALVLLPLPDKVGTGVGLFDHGV